MPVIDSATSIFEQCSPETNPFGEENGEEEIEDIVIDSVSTPVAIDTE